MKEAGVGRVSLLCPPSENPPRSQGSEDDQECSRKPEFSLVATFLSCQHLDSGPTRWEERQVAYQESLVVLSTLLLALLLLVFF